MGHGQARSAPQLAVTAVLLCAALLASGCFGKFQVTRNLYAFNRTTSQDRFARSAVFLAMNLAPMYPVGVVIDACLANPVEFWTGENPVKDSQRWFPPPPEARATSLGGSLRMAAAEPAPGRCRTDALDDWYCAKDPNGVAVLDNLGAVLCAPGRCVEVEDEWQCSSVSGGGARITPNGPVCDGDCRAPRAVDCERGIGATSSSQPG